MRRYFIWSRNIWKYFHFVLLLTLFSLCFCFIKWGDWSKEDTVKSQHVGSQWNLGVLHILKNNIITLRATAIAQWIRLRLQSSHPRFESKAHYLCFHQFIQLCNVEKTKINKKRPGLAHFFKKKPTKNHYSTQDSLKHWPEKAVLKVSVQSYKVDSETSLLSHQRTFTIDVISIVQLVSSLPGLDWVAFMHNIFYIWYFLVW